MSMGKKATGLSTALPSHAYVPFSANNKPATVAKKTGIERRRVKKYVEKPAMSSREMWNHRSPLGSAKSNVSGKNAADCISPSNGEPRPSK